MNQITFGLQKSAKKASDSDMHWSGENFVSESTRCRITQCKTRMR